MRGSPEGGGIANLARYVALLRGINLGKQNRVPMTTLREMLADLGYIDIATHLQSGNAVFTTGRKSAQTLVRSSRGSNAISGWISPLLWYRLRILPRSWTPTRWRRQAATQPS
jgi:Protein of unknown function (DUF1697)